MRVPAARLMRVQAKLATLGLGAEYSTVRAVPHMPDREVLAIPVRALPAIPSPMQRG